MECSPISVSHVILMWFSGSVVLPPSLAISSHSVLHFTFYYFIQLYFLVLIISIYSVKAVLLFYFPLLKIDFFYTIYPDYDFASSYTCFPFLSLLSPPYLSFCVLMAGLSSSSPTPSARLLSLSQLYSILHCCCVAGSSVGRDDSARAPPPHLPAYPAKRILSPLYFYKTQHSLLSLELRTACCRIPCFHLESRSQLAQTSGELPSSPGQHKSLYGPRGEFIQSL